MNAKVIRLRQSFLSPENTSVQMGSYNPKRSVPSHSSNPFSFLPDTQPDSIFQLYNGLLANGMWIEFISGLSGPGQKNPPSLSLTHSANWTSTFGATLGVDIEDVRASICPAPWPRSRPFSHRPLPIRFEMSMRAKVLWIVTEIGEFVRAFNAILIHNLREFFYLGG